MKPKGKCFAKKCEDCNWWDDWNLTNPQTQEKKIEKICSFRVLVNEIPKMIGSIDGLQGGVNEARNASLKTEGSTRRLADNTRFAIKAVANKFKELEGNNGGQIKIN